MRSLCHIHEKRGFTVIEILVALLLAGILATMATPRIGSMRDRLAVYGAANDAEGIFASARHIAIARGERVAALIDTARQTLSIVVHGDTLRVRRVGATYGVTMKCNRPGITYASNGIGYGVSNLTLVLVKGNAIDTLTISRLGRVKRSR